MTQDSFTRYRRAAQRKQADPAAILETALADPEITAGQLGELASVLLDHHGFKAPKSMRDQLIDTLLEADITAKRISDMLGCHPRTVARRQPAQVGSTNGLNKRPRRDKNEARDLGPILSFSAAGGGDDTRVILQVLRGEAA